MIEDYLLQVRKPARYIGGEWNVTRKDFDRADVRFALCFPDLYEIGMSNIGIRIIYGLLNAMPQVVCERFFSPDVDMEALVRSKKAGFVSLESKRPLGDFDIIGISLGYELCFTNILNILDLGGITLESFERDNKFPLVIGGGPCVLNPEPMHEFFDLFVLGEAEEVMHEIIDLYLKHKEDFKSGRMTKRELLLELSAIGGVYVPSLYEVVYDSGQRIAEFKPAPGAPETIKKRFVKNLQDAFFPCSWLVPYIQLVHDRIALEIMRGCPNRCRFCQARSQYFPFRFKTSAGLTKAAAEIYQRTGYEEISLCGLSVTDHPHIEDLLKTLIGAFGQKAVSLSLPSVKPKAYMGDLSSLISTIKKTGLTFAPEAASARLREVLGKDFSEEDFFSGLEKAYASGYQHVKLYFMIGLPTEEDRDLDAIIDFAGRVSELRRRVHKGSALVNISVNTMIPKPHTPFQWLKALDPEEIRHKQEYLKSKNKNKRLKINFHNCQTSLLEAALSRGDRRLSGVIRNAFKQGARFDAWQNHFRPDYWQRAFEEQHLDIHGYLRQKDKHEFLPWDFMDIGIDKKVLRLEYEKVVAMEQDKKYNEL